MKVLFAVSNEEISESIVKKYQKEYKQIISYKNVYYFNAILKELQKDKTYDRVVISEDLEAFTHTQYDQIDKFIFDKLDSISDEAANIRGNDIPVILICSDRRTKSEEMLIKLFGIGVYNAIIGTDRSVDGVCKLINRPRSKKEAKIYYKIEADDVSYQKENENDVSEMEIQNIIAHYKKIGKNESQYIDSFNNIAAQYNDTQLRIISKFLPLNVRAVLEEKSTKYQQIMSFNNTVSDNLRIKAKEQEEGPSEKLLSKEGNDKIMSRPVVIPSPVSMTGGTKIGRKKPVTPEPRVVEKVSRTEPEEVINHEPVEELILPGIEESEEVVQPVRRGRGRPRKNAGTEVMEAPAESTKRGRGRPKKVQDNDVEPNAPILPLDTEVEQKVEPEVEEYAMLPGLENPVDDKIPQEEPEPTILPGFEENETIVEPIMERPKSVQNYAVNSILSQPVQQKAEPETKDLSNLLTPDKKIVTFIGTSKNGTSFIVNNLAQLLSSMGINTAILDTTKNRNSYYVYTDNDESLRQIATNCIGNLINGEANGISVNKNLTVYTSLPDEEDTINHVDEILETLLKKHSLILIDTDYKTPRRYFKQSQETYLVQSLDVLTIQPLTAFLKELKSRNILDEKKLRIILNKTVKIKGITDKIIIGGMSNYNDPAMTVMTELFDRNLIKYISIPFEEKTYAKYLEGIIECKISLNGYSKVFMQTLKELANMVYSTTNAYRPPSTGMSGTRDGFSPSMNNTLNQMKNNY